jgi:hypothetical protein
MGIVNRRNAVLGWATWQVGKAAAKSKAKQSLKPEDSRRPGKGMVVGTLAAAGGALWFLRRRRGDSDSDGDSKSE